MWRAVLTTWLRLQSPSCDEWLDVGMDVSELLSVELTGAELRASCCLQGATAFPQTDSSKFFLHQEQFEKTFHMFLSFFLKERKRGELVGQNEDVGNTFELFLSALNVQCV